jgi:hypothetical protein
MQPFLGGPWYGSRARFWPACYGWERSEPPQARTSPLGGLPFGYGTKLLTGPEEAPEWRNVCPHSDFFGFPDPMDP